MNTFKKVILTGVLTGAAVCFMASSAQATTVKVTGDTLNIRKGASTNTEVIAMLSKGVECELIEEVDGWYKIKYKNYTGYISKEYSEIVEDSEENTNNNQDENQNNEENNQTSEGQSSNNQNANDTNDQNSQEGTNNSDNTSNSENSTNITIVYKKFLQDTDIKILPLIYSSNIGNIKKGVEVMIITETTGWSYIQTNTINGWVRTTSLGEARTVNTNPNGGTTSSSTESKDDTTQDNKIGYINNAQGVNLRKGAGTNYNVIKALSVNTQVTILKEEGNWYQVKVGNDTGYVSKDYVSDSKTTSSRSSASRTQNDEEIEAKENSAQTSSASKQETNIESKSNSTNGSDKASNEDTKTNSSTQSNASTKSNSNATTQKTETANQSNNTTESSSKASELISYAKKYLGCKYVYGGNGSNGTFDCSGFTMYVYKHFGINLPHGANSQYKSGKGTKITKQSDLKMGDIVFLTDYYTGVGISHCGIYIGNGEFIHASTTTYTVTISSLNTTYKGRFYAGLRLI